MSVIIDFYNQPLINFVDSNHYLFNKYFNDSSLTPKDLKRLRQIFLNRSKLGDEEAFQMFEEIRTLRTKQQEDNPCE